MVSFYEYCLWKFFKPVSFFADISKILLVFYGNSLKKGAQIAEIFPAFADFRRNVDEKQFIWYVSGVSIFGPDHMF